MKFISIIFSFIILSSCSIRHEIEIFHSPCLYPYKDFDFTLCQDFYYKINGKSKLIPKGFTTDLASIPRILWSIYSPTKVNTISASVIHDYLYFCPNKISRMEADSIFYDALIYNGVSIWTSFKYWIGVRIFGTSHFNSGYVCPSDPDWPMNNESVS